jgi:hypothetical protein
MYWLTLFKTWLQLQEQAAKAAQRRKGSGKVKTSGKGGSAKRGRPQQGKQGKKRSRPAVEDDDDEEEEQEEDDEEFDEVCYSSCTFRGLCPIADLHQHGSPCAWQQQTQLCYRSVGGGWPVHMLLNAVITLLHDTCAVH